MNKKIKIHPFILSGGSGRRLWPLSRSLYPKQFVQLQGSLSYFQKTIKRLDKKIFTNPNIICNINHRFMVKDQSSVIKQRISKIYLEPIGKNTTAAAITSAVASNENDLILLLPSDHLIENSKIFNECIKTSIQPALDGKIVLFGVKPNKPDTNFGYISAEKIRNSKHFKINKFIEKPNLKKSKELYKANSTFWNSGIFLFKASTLVDESKKYCLKNYLHTLKAFENKKFDGEYYFLEKKYFAKNKNISIDYSLIQKSNLLVMSKLNTKWSDMGSWESYWHNNKKNSSKNVVMGNNVSYECKNSLIYSDKQLTVTLGVNDLIIASFSDSLLVMDKRYSNQLSGIINKMEQKKYDELDSSPKCFRPWGSYESLKSGQGFQIKEIIVNPNSAISLQRHKKRSEHWVVIKGIATVTKGNKKIQLKKNESIDIKVGEIHRLENKTKKELKIIEIQTGEYLGEDDIIRYKDDYKRV